MQGKVEICGIHTADLRVLKNDEMMELLKQAQAGPYSSSQFGDMRVTDSPLEFFIL